MSGASLYDVIIVGGGPGGSSAGIALARRGRRVLLLERERFPRFHVGESLLPGLWEMWEELGVAEKLEASDFPIKRGVRFALPGLEKDISLRTDEFPDYFPRTYTYHVDRARYDQMMLQHARECGVEVREGCVVDEPLLDGERVVGVRARTESGQRESLYAPVTIDASGRACLLARRFGGRTPDPALNKLSYFAHFEGARRLASDDEVTTDIHTIEGGWLWYIPLANDVVSVGAVLDAGYVRDIGIKGVEARFRHAVGHSERIAGWIEGATRIGEVQTISNISYQNASFVGDGYLLVGDAAVFVDPIFSAGVTLAVRSGLFAAEAVDEALLAGDVGAGQLAAYEARIRHPMSRIFKLIYSWYDILKRGDRNNVFVRSQRIPILRERLVVLLSGGYDRADLESFMVAAPGEVSEEGLG